jgi:Holliday junction resolvase RusA-like endonuclease
MGMLNPNSPLARQILSHPGTTIHSGPPTLPLDTEETAALKSGLAKLAAKVCLPEADRFTVTLPLPPSTNNLFKNAGKRRILTTEYEDWRTGAAVAMRLTRLVRVPSPLAVTLTLCGKVNRGSDLANREKAAVDFLVSKGIIAGDSLMHVHELHMLYRPDEGEARIEVAVETGTTL